MNLIAPAALITAMAAAIAALRRMNASGERYTYTTEIFIRAPAQKIWDTYLNLGAKTDYMPGARTLDVTEIATHPLQIRSTIQWDYRRTPITRIATYHLFNPPHTSIASDDIAPGFYTIETLTLTEDADGTWLQIEISLPPLLGRLLHFIEPKSQNLLEALAAHCENRPLPHRKRPWPRLRYETPILLAGILLLIALPAKAGTLLMLAAWSIIGAVRLWFFIARL